MQRKPIKRDQHCSTLAKVKQRAVAPLHRGYYPPLLFLNKRGVFQNRCITKKVITQVATWEDDTSLCNGLPRLQGVLFEDFLNQSMEESLLQDSFVNAWSEIEFLLTNKVN
jgi:hypothetical protein